MSSDRQFAAWLATSCVILGPAATHWLRRIYSESTCFFERINKAEFGAGRLQACTKDYRFTQSNSFGAQSRYAPKSRFSWRWLSTPLRLRESAEWVSSEVSRKPVPCKGYGVDRIRATSTRRDACLQRTLRNHAVPVLVNQPIVSGSRRRVMPVLQSPEHFPFAKK